MRLRRLIVPYITYVQFCPDHVLNASIPDDYINEFVDIVKLFKKYFFKALR